MAAPSMIPAFFKVFDPESCSETLQIPCSFTRTMKGKLPGDTAFLRNGFGNVWPVEFTRKRGNTYFKNGWVKFVQDNGVEPEDRLLFQFNGDYYFDVKHFDKDGCENLEEWVMKSNQEDVKVRKINKSGPKKKIGGSRPTLGKGGTSTNRSKGKGKAVIKDEVGLENYVDAAARRCVDAFESGLIARPKNPFFIAHMRPSKRNELSIPHDVIKEHNLEIPDEIVVVGDDGKEFHSMVNTWADGRKRVTNGWRAFRRWNRVSDEDTCLCEFLSNHTLLIHVLTFQAGKWMPRPDEKLQNDLVLVTME